MPSRNRHSREAADEGGKRAGLVKIITTIAVFCLIIYSVFNIISQQAQIAQLKQQNDEYIRLLSADDESEYMERIAIERLGYAYPNERRFYVVEGK